MHVFFLLREAALRIINDDNWMAAMRNKTWEQNHVTTPLRKLITKLPGKFTSFPVGLHEIPLFVYDIFTYKLSWRLVKRVVFHPC